ncbi:MAG: phosphoglucosamine mutase [Pseudoalteromonas tetraodonis]|jgi:phosphoglucosamine mutase
MHKIKFGTDGIRGPVGVYPMTAQAIVRLGQAAGKVIASHSKNSAPKVLIGKDTRISGYMFESALEAGFSASGVNIRMLGPMPTPAIAYLTRTFRADAGIVISASHNPYYDNGIKFFGPDGTKLSDELELEIIEAFSGDLTTVDSSMLGQVRRIEDAGGRYIEFCKSTFPTDLSLAGLTIVVDGANGAAYKVAPRVFRELGATIHVIGDRPDGLNINQDVGSTAPAALQAAVLEHGADLGIALDGDADRLQMVGACGELIDGDQLLWILATYRQDIGALRGPVVGTIMSNLGLEQKLKSRGIEFIRANVGDRNVIAQLQKHDGVIGGETSGHIICMDKTTTGDGCVAALDVLSVIQATGRSLTELASEMPQFPQTTINIDVVNAVDVSSDPDIQTAKLAAETALGNRGRVILRASGTQPLVRVTVEAETVAMVEEHVTRLAAVVKQKIG